MGVKKEEEPDKAVTEDGKVDYRCAVLASSELAPKVVACDRIFTAFCSLPEL